MKLPGMRIEVMQTIEKSMDELINKYLKKVDENWQPTDYLPDSNDPDFHDEVKEMQDRAKDMSEELLVVLVGDTITEEALPTYESWLMSLHGLDQEKRTGWTEWDRGWTAEENRHGDLLNKYLYLCGRVNMKEVEISTQHLIRDGFDIQTGNDPYRNFIYTSFQELATNVSHRKVAILAKEQGDRKLARMCGLIAADEARHATAYKNFSARIFELDPSEMMIAFEDMLRKKIIKPAHFLREAGGELGGIWTQFSDAAQRIKVYTAQDYIDILDSLVEEWDIGHMLDLNESAEKARDYLMALPKRLQRMSERMTIPEVPYKFKWISS